MSRKFFLALVITVVCSWAVSGQELYRWVDDSGTVHFTDDLTRIPERYRDRIERKRTSEKPAPSERTSPEPPMKRPPAPRRSERRDLLGRDEAWWRAKVKEWEDKLRDAQENVERLQAEIRQKEKELAEVRLKPDKFKTKLKRVESEIKALQAEARTWEDQVVEAKKMLEKVLPQEAIDFLADPEWLKPKEAGRP